MFKLEHPANLVSRLFLLEYIRDLDNNTLYEKANSAQKKNLFYKFTNEETGEESVDVNWEYALFVATMGELEFFMKNFLEEIKEIDKVRDKKIKKRAKQLERKQKTADINLMDFAKASISKQKQGLDVS